MNYQEYAPLAIRTAKFIDPVTDIYHAYMGIITEVGEIVDAFKRSIIYGKSLDLVNLEEEIGDCFWYLNLLWHVTDTKAEPTDAESLAVQAAYADSVEMSNLAPFLLAIAKTAGDIVVSPTNGFELQAQLEYLAKCHSIELGKCLDKNIAKLAARYGDKYSDYRALNRDLGTERAVLEVKA